MSFRLARFAAAILSLALCTPVAAQGYPSKPVKIVVPFAAGGAVDIITRILGEKLQPVLGQQIVVEPITGAGGNIGSAAVAKAAPDGHTLLMATTGTHTINPGLYKNMPFDAEKDFAPITIIASVPNLLVVHPSVPAKTVKELIDLARSQPGKMNFASFGHGTSNHLSGELLNSVAGIRTTHVPYKSAPQAVLELVGGQVSYAFVNAPLALPQVKAGKLRALAVTGAQRSPAVPELPTMKEAGLDFVVESWYGLMAPAGTPRPIIDKIYRDTIAVLKRPEVVEGFAQRGADVATSASPEEFAKMVSTEKARWTDVIVKSGAKID